jgi:hypothetical protein
MHVQASADYVKGRMPIPVDPEVIDDNTCIVEVGSDAPHHLLRGWACSAPTSTYWTLPNWRPPSKS